MRPLPLLVPLTALAALAGCTDSRPEEIAVSVIGVQPRLKDPDLKPLTTGEAVLLENVARGLVMFDGQGEIVPGLAERWNVSDDGLSYIFRLEATEWPDARKITAQEVARLMRRKLGRTSRNALKDSLGAISEIVPMTDRVLEIRLITPRPQLLQQLAQPEMALLRQGQGTGPFRLRSPADDGSLRLRREISDLRSETTRDQRVRLRGDPAADAVRRFVTGDVQLVLGGTFADLPVARSVRLQRNTLRFDPAIGLFGLVPARERGPLASRELRRLLSQAIDRDGLVAALRVPGLVPRATVLQPGLGGLLTPTTPAWAATPLAQRLPELVAQADELFAEDDDEEQRPTLAIALPDGPGAKLLLERLATDWGRLGIGVVAATPGTPADLKLIDRVAPSISPAWFLRRFRCAEVPVCSRDIDDLLAGARTAPNVGQRNYLLAQADRLITEQQLFIPLAAPVRWSLVGRSLPAFHENPLARHPLWDLERRSR